MADSLWCYGSRLYSHPANGASAYLSVGTAVTNAPVAGLIDGLLGVYAAANETTAAFGVNLGIARAPEIAFVGNHNITAGTVRLQAAADDTYGALIVDVPMTYTQPHFWVDLRSIAAASRTARHWRVSVTGNAAAVRIGELVIGAVESTWCYQWGYVEIREYLERVKGITPWEVLHRTKLNITRRGRSGVRFVGPDAVVEDVLRRVAYNAGRTVIPVIFVPLDTEADAWMIDWPDQYVAKRVIENRLEVVLPLPEQAPGLLSALLGSRAVASAGATVHYAKAYLSTNVSISHNTVTPVAFNTEVADVSGMHDNVSNPSHFVVQTAGQHIVVGQASWAPSAGSWAAVMVYVNGVRRRMGEAVLHGTYGLTHQTFAIEDLSVGDYIEIYVQQNSGSSLSLLGGSADLTGVEIYGPLP